MSQSENSEEMSKLISAHVTPSQKRDIRVAAAKRDMSISEYVRTCLLEEARE